MPNMGRFLKILYNKQIIKNYSLKKGKSPREYSILSSEYQKYIFKYDTVFTTKNMPT
jgi:hypothetical protein